MQNLQNFFNVAYLDNKEYSKVLLENKRFGRLLKLLCLKSGGWVGGKEEFYELIPVSPLIENFSSPKVEKGGGGFFLDFPSLFYTSI
ncbi:MAG: hypothetical protein IPO04_07130 [Cytophagaceae bacterium]|nr:hypothetical protein [Cytophagaceae bacterium]